MYGINGHLDNFTIIFDAKLRLALYLILRWLTSKVKKFIKLKIK